MRCGTYSGTRNGRPVMGLSSSAVKVGAGRGAVARVTFVMPNSRGSSIPGVGHGPYPPPRGVYAAEGGRRMGRVIWDRATVPRYSGEVCPHLPFGRCVLAPPPDTIRVARRKEVNPMPN